MIVSSNSRALSFPKLPDNNLRLQQSRDGFLDRIGSRRQSQIINVSELKNGLLDETSDHHQSQNIVNVSSLQDISPTEWSYEGLRSLVERYGCIAGFPDRTFRGDRTLSRHEFSAALNTCLSTMERLLQENAGILREDIEKLKKIAYEFEGEIKSLGSRAGNLESRVAFSENHQFSTTTSLTGEMIMGLAGITSGEKEEGTKDIFKVNNIGYRGRIKLNTTFDGNDSLYIRFTAGTTPSYSDITDTFEGKLSFTHPYESDLAIQLIIYDFAIAENVRMFVEPVGGAFDDFVPTVNFLDGDAASGALSAFGTRNPLYYMPGGPGIGLRGQLFEVFEWSGGYLADKGANPDLGAGMFNGPYGVMGQLAYEPNDNFKIAFTYLHGYNNLDSGTGSRRANFQSFIEEEFDASVKTINNSYRMEFSWHVFDQFVLGGWGGFTTTKTLGSIDLGGDLEPINRGNIDIWNWAVTLAFPDAIVEGDTAGIIIGMEPWVSKSNIVLPNGLRNNDRDSSFHLEAIYKYPISDNIAITPGLTIITSPDYDNSNNTLVIGTIRTTFTF